MNKYIKLNDLGYVSRGRSQHRPRNAPHLYDGKYPFIQTADITKSDLYITSYSQTYTEAGLSQSRLWDTGTLCIANAGVNTGDNAILGFKACFPDSVIGFIADKSKCNVLFVKYYLDVIKPQIKSITMGATQDNLSVSKLLTFDIPNVSLDIQDKIAGILSAYDDLIENNKRRIALLENMAEELYREWFVRFRFPGWRETEFEKGIPKGWEFKTIDTFCTEVRSGIKKSKLKANEKYLGLEHLSRKSISIKEYTTADTVDSDKLKFQDGDILFGKIRPYLHKVALAHFSGVCSTDTIVLRAKKDIHKGFLLFTVFSETFIDLATTSSTGTKMPRADWDFLKKIEIVQPKEELLILFNKNFESMFLQITKLLEANGVLEKTKNVLLPRLISGKLAVEDLAVQLPPSMRETTS